MPRYIVAPKLASMANNAASRDAASLPGGDAIKSALYGFRAAIATHADIIAEPDENTETLIVECDAASAAAKHREMSDDAMFEAEKYRWHCLFHPLAAPQAAGQALPAGFGAAIELDVTLQNEPIEGAVAVLFLSMMRGGYTTNTKAITDSSGRAVLAYDPRIWLPISITVNPHSRAWAGYLAVTGPRLAIALTALPRSGPLGWWHHALGLTSYCKERGAGIRVGIIDTGIGDHPYLSHAKRLGAILNGQLDSSVHSTDDAAEHGTHVAGIIGARPTDLKDFAGVAPGAELVVLRVYAKSDTPGGDIKPATNGDIAQAIIRLARDEQCDIINLSSGGPLRSDIEFDRISAARNVGTLVICAAGNGSGPPVQYPAAERNVIGVSALGILGGVPASALDIMSLPATPDRYNGFGSFLAAFSSFGPEIKCIGPGVGIISTVPPRRERQPPYLAASGTSMAAPAITGVLAAMLSRDPIYKTLPRGYERSLRAWKVLMLAVRSMGLYFPYQGFGLPIISPSSSQEHRT